MSNFEIVKLTCNCQCNESKELYQNSVNDAILCKLDTFELVCNINDISEVVRVTCDKCTSTDDLYNFEGDILCYDCACDHAWNYLDDDTEFNAAWYEYYSEHFTPYERPSNLDAIKDEFTQDYFIKNYLDDIK